jgi:hypothetical protein
VPACTTAILAQHLRGALTCLLIATLGARTVSRRVGLAAGVLAALSGPLIFAESQLLKEGPALLLWVLSLHLWLDLLEDRGRRPAALRGALLGLGVLLRGSTYILLLLVLATLLLRVGGGGAVEAALVLGCALLALSPATIHNLGRASWSSTTRAAATRPSACGRRRRVTAWLLAAALRAATRNTRSGRRGTGRAGARPAALGAGIPTGGAASSTSWRIGRASRCSACC